jgi:hypothetical protein
MKSPAPATVPPPYRAQDAADLLGCTLSHILRHYEDIEGAVKIGSMVLVPRAYVDRLVYGPDGPEQPFEGMLHRLLALDSEQLRQVILRAAELMGPLNTTATKRQQ